MKNRTIVIVPSTTDPEVVALRAEARKALSVLTGILRCVCLAQEIAERLAGSVAGTVLPFTFSPDLELIVDPSLLENHELTSTRRGWLARWS